MPSYLHIPKKMIGDCLEQQPVVGKHFLLPFGDFADANTLPIKILENSQSASTPELHRDYNDLWLCLEGEVVFVCGGKLVNQYQKDNKDGTTNNREWRGAKINGGSEVIVKPGDWLWIPANVPHLHQSKGTARLIIIKIPKQNGRNRKVIKKD